MRQSSGDKEGKLSNREYWTALLEGPLESMHARATEELAKEPEIPEALHYLHEWWCELEAGRRYGMGGAEPLAYADIAAWARLAEHEPTAEEVAALVYMDRVVLNPGKRDDGERR